MFFLTNQETKRKALLLKGSGQVGKTFSLQKFGEEEYKNTVYLNFEDNARLSKFFDAGLDLKTIIKALSIEKDAEIFDEEPKCSK